MIAAAPSTLKRYICKLDDNGKRALFALFRELAPEVPNASESIPVVAVRRCGIHPYGLDYDVEFADGSHDYQRDTDLAYYPGAPEAIAAYWATAPRTFSREQLIMLSKLPQYAWAEGDFLGPMWRRTLTDPSVVALNSRYF